MPARWTLLPLLFLLLRPPVAWAQVRPLELVAVGKPRALPERILGASAEPFWDDFLRDPAKVAAIKSLHLAYTRFPGGSQSNYYDWRRGLFFVPAGASHSPYYERFVTLSRFVNRKLPEGIFLEQYKTFSDSIDAEIVMVPNLETASVADQAEWFRHLSIKGAVPRHIELGNEFWVAMGQDPEVLRHWPDEPTSMRLTERYLNALREYLPKGAKVAVQATAPTFRGEPSSHSPMIERLRQWNDNLRPEPWFDAVTIHLYPRLNEVIGNGAAEDPITPPIARRNLRALMARVDEGTDGELRDVARQVPGKEIWITEWNPAGAEGAGKENRAETTTPAMMLQLVTRMTLAFLRHRQVTIAQFFSIRFKPDSPKCMFLAENGGYRAVPVAVALRWLNVAANGGASYQRFLEAGNPRIPGRGVRSESYGAVEAALFRSHDHVTLILQNASGAARVWTISPDLNLGIPSHAEQMAMPDLVDPAIRIARVEKVAVATDIPVPAYSLTRVVWNVH
jgi:hypothetical protein